MTENHNYFIVINSEYQYSIWPDGKEIPKGWKAIGKSTTKKECLQIIKEKWIDIRPKSLLESIQRKSEIKNSNIISFEEKHLQMIDTYKRRYEFGLDSWSKLPYLKDCVDYFFTKFASPSTQKKVFEIGIGTGISSEPILEKGFSLTGIDVVYNKNWEKLKDLYPSQFKATVDDIIVYNITEKYDIVMDNGCFHHFEPDLYTPTLNKVKDLLVKNGDFFLTVFEETNLELDKGRVTYLDAGKRRCKFFTIPEIKNLLEKNDFKLKNFERIKRDFDGIKILLCVATKLN